MSEFGELGDIVPFARAGEDTLNDRSVIEPLLLVLCKPGRPGLAPLTFTLPAEDVDPRLTIRFVCKFPTGSGEVVCDRRAAAAAAEEREDMDCDRPGNALCAAVAAAKVVLVSIGYTRC